MFNRRNIKLIWCLHNKAKITIKVIGSKNEFELVIVVTTLPPLYSILSKLVLELTKIAIIPYTKECSLWNPLTLWVSNSKTGNPWLPPEYIKILALLKTQKFTLKTKKTRQVMVHWFLDICSVILWRQISSVI